MLKTLLHRLLLSLAQLGVFAGNAFARAGSDGSPLPWWAEFAVIFVFIYLFLYLYQWRNKLKRTKRLMKRLARLDPMWDSQTIEPYVRRNFKKLKQTWCEQDMKALKEIVHPVLFDEWRDRLREMMIKGHRDVMKDIVVHDVKFVDVRNFRDDDRDEFTVEIYSSAEHQTLDSDGNVVSSKRPPFYEFWTYEREDGQWLLREVNTGKRDERFLRRNIDEGAAE